MLRQMLGPNGESAAQIEKDTGISEIILYKWKKARTQEIVFGNEEKKLDLNK